MRVAQGARRNFILLGETDASWSEPKRDVGSGAGTGCGATLSKWELYPQFFYVYIYMYMYIMYYICIIYIYGISPLISGIVGVIYMNYQPLAKWDGSQTHQKKNIYYYSKHSGKVWQIAAHPFPSED